MDYARGAARTLLQGHAATLAAVTAAPDALVLAAAAHCAAMSPLFEHSTQATASPLRLDEWHLSPPFRWSPLPVRRVLGAWGPRRRRSPVLVRLVLPLVAVWV